jgi:hypothetical protein
MIWTHFDIKGSGMPTSIWETTLKELEAMVEERETDAVASPIEERMTRIDYRTWDEMSWGDKKRQRSEGSGGKGAEIRRAW